MADLTCPSCQKRSLETDAERANHLCEHCAAGTGVPDRPATLRPALPCPRCRHHVFLRAAMRERTSTSGDYGNEYVAPLGISFAVRDTAVFGTTIRADPGKPLGLLFAHVCRGCGYTELYTEGFAELPVGPQFGTELIQSAPDQAGPFR